MKLKKPQEKAIKDAETFISEANYGKTESITNPYPWDGLDHKKMKAFNLRLPLDVYAKLQYLGENLPRTSMNNLCLEVIEPYLELKLTELLEAKSS